MPTVDYLLMLGEITLGEVLNINGTQLGWVYKPYIQHSKAASIISHNMYHSRDDCINGVKYLLPPECRDYITILRRENGRVVERIAVVPH